MNSYPSQGGHVLVMDAGRVKIAVFAGFPATGHSGQGYFYILSINNKYRVCAPRHWRSGVWASRLKKRTLTTLVAPTSQKKRHSHTFLALEGLARVRDEFIRRHLGTEECCPIATWVSELGRPIKIPNGIRRLHSTHHWTNTKGTKA